MIKLTNIKTKYIVVFMLSFVIYYGKEKFPTNYINNCHVVILKISKIDKIS